VRAWLGLAALGALVIFGVWLSTFRGSDLRDDAIAAPTGVPDPVASGEETPPGYRQIFPRDAIEPVYNPTFVPGSESDWIEGTLVIGIEFNGEAKAYPVNFLNGREMVNDWIGGTPVLVTW
jgi:hypothetical protein